MVREGTALLLRILKYAVEVTLGLADNGRMA